MVKREHSFLSFHSKPHFLFIPKLVGIGGNTHSSLFRSIPFISIIYTHSIIFHSFIIYSFHFVINSQTNP